MQIAFGIGHQDSLSLHGTVLNAGVRRWWYVRDSQYVMYIFPVHFPGSSLGGSLFIMNVVHSTQCVLLQPVWDCFSLCFGQKQDLSYSYNDR